MPSYLITGGAGFIGSHIAEALVNKGAGVTILDDLSSGSLRNIETFKQSVTFIKGDLRSREDVRKAVEGVDAVFHQAAIPSVVRSFDDPEASLSVNITGTAVLLEVCRKMGVAKVICASSSSVYGDSPTLPKEETMQPAPKSPYALSKLSCESLLAMYSKVYGMQTIALRYFNVFGARQDPESEYSAVIPKFITAILRGKTPVIFGDGCQSRDFCHIENVVSANLLCLERDGLSGNVINVACGERINLLELVEKINAITGRNIKPRFGPERAGDVKHSLASIRRASELIGYKVGVTVEDGLKDTVNHFKNYVK